MIKYILILFLLNGCVGASSKGVFGTGVSVALDPRTLGTQIDDGIMDKNLDAKLILMNKKITFPNEILFRSSESCSFFLIPKKELIILYNHI